MGKGGTDMRELYQLKEKLCDELKAYGKKGEVSAGSLAMIDTLAHAIKNIDKIIDHHKEEEGMYSSRPSFEGGFMRGADGMGESYSRRMYRDGYSRGRDAMGRYSLTGDMVSELQDLMRNAPDERTRQKIQSIIYKMDEK